MCVGSMVGVVRFEPTQPKHLFYRQAQLSNVGAPPISLTFFNAGIYSVVQFYTSWE